MRLILRGAQGRAPQDDVRTRGQTVSRETTPCAVLRGLPSRFASQIGRENSQSRGRQTIEPARLPHGARPRRFKLGARLVGEPGHLGIVDIGQNQPFVAPEGVNVSGLALQIDIVFGVDLQMDRNRWVNGR